MLPLHSEPLTVEASGLIFYLLCTKTSLVPHSDWPKISNTFTPGIQEHFIGKKKDRAMCQVTKRNSSFVYKVSFLWEHFD